jgi:hypothetical protein
MAKPQQQDKSVFTDMRTAFNVFTLGADIVTACVRPFTRSRIGTSGMSWAGFTAMIAIPVYAATAEAPGMLGFWHAWLAMVIYRRITADTHQHSQYQGLPWMFAWCRSELTARALEAGTMPLLGSAAGTLFGEDVGLFISASTFAFAYRYVIDRMTVARRNEAARNARIEMESTQHYAQ